MRCAETIGIIGGMGSYATQDFFRRLLDAFPSEKEWDRPRIVIDNRCTMPSRVRAILYGEQPEKIVEELTNAVRGLLACGVDHLIFACNTSHAFVPEVLEQVPEAAPKVVNIIDTLAKQMQEAGVSSAYLLASEGTIETKIYPYYFEQYGISVSSPSSEMYGKLREFIEVVKQGRVTENARTEFCSFVKSIPSEQVILGCTEFPVLMTANQSDGVWDPLDAAIKAMKAVIK
jgi:aspartate racemase